MKQFNRILSLVLACIISFGVLCEGVTVAWAATDQMTVYVYDLPRGGGDTQSWGHDAVSLMGGWSSAEKSDNWTVFCQDSYTGQMLYCIEPGVSCHTGDSYTADTDSYWDDYPDNLNPTISANEIEVLLGRVLYYGYQGYGDTSRSQDDSADAEEIAMQIATQLLVWETVVGERDASFNNVWTSAKSTNRVTDLIRDEHPLYDLIFSYYADIACAVQLHTTLPSFCSDSESVQSSYELTWNGSNYSATLTDSNQVLANYSFSTDAVGVTLSVNGDTLTISSDSVQTEAVSIIATNNNASRTDLLVWTDGNITAGTQDLIGYSGTVSDSINGYLSAEVLTGAMAIVKTSEDDQVSGIKFTITGDDYEVTRTTDADGIITLTDLPAGSYTVTEESLDQYTPQDSQQVTVSSGQTTSVTFDNVLKKFNVTVTKIDAVTTTAQGDGALEGAVYGIYQDGVLVDSYTTDKNGQFTTDYYVCNDNWTICEISPSEGYLLDSTVYSVNADPTLYSKEYNSTTLTVTEQVVSGSIAIVKHSDDGSTQIETPEAGATFEVYLSSAGSYDNADSNERDLLVCDEDGFAQSIDLPYGVYTVHQTVATDGCALVADFEVYIAQDGVTYRYIINNASFCAYLKIVKTDAETGEAVAYAGAGFQIYDPDGELVTMSYTYPTMTTIDIFYTDADGMLVTPETLDYGIGYSIVEVQAPYGYTLDSEPIYFDVVQDQASTENGVTIIEVTRANMAQKGSITIQKTGEVFATVTEVDGVYTPIYEIAGLAGAVYQVTATEDIYTQDGTLRAIAGEVVDVITTDENGMASTTLLYLGNYEIVEITAPAGMVLNDEVYAVELLYAGQEVAVTDLAVSVQNERQTVRISFEKTLETDPLVTIDYAEQLSSVVFGLYNSVELVATDGSVIPIDSLLEQIGVDADGTATFTADLPYGSYYIKELATGSYYLLDDSVYPIEFTDQGQDVAVVQLDINEGQAIQNTLLRGSLSIVKTSDDGVVEGFSFRVVGDNGYDQTFITDQDGYIVIDDLCVGSYTISEVENEMSADYLLPDAVTVDIFADAIVTIEMQNTLIPVPDEPEPIEPIAVMVDTPQTGDQAPTALLLVSGLLALLAAGYLVKKKSHPKQEEETDGKTKK